MRPAHVVCAGKEANQFEAVEAGLAEDPHEVWTEYAAPRRDPWLGVVLPVLKRIPGRRLAEEAEFAVSMIKAARNRRTRPG